MRIEYTNIVNQNLADILVITATKVETEMLHKNMLPVCKDGILEIVKDDKTYYAGILGNYNVIHCQCKSMGSQGKDSSILTTTNALMDWPDVRCVIMVGIAFGMYESEGTIPQHYADILVSQEIWPYENQRQNPDGSIEYRSSSCKADKHLVDAFILSSAKWERKNLMGENTRIEVCEMLSGEKLIDNLDERNKLKNAFPNCRGGEMEGVGIASACEKFSKPWIVIKGICDFADGNKKEGKKEKQKDAAMAAVEACINALNTENAQLILQGGVNYYYRENNQREINNLFFLHYTHECAPYYLLRNADRELQPYILTKSSWVYGPAGMGKSELLQHTLTENNVEFVYIDLSLAESDEEAFVTVLDTICERVNVDCPQCANYNDIIRAIGNILAQYYIGKTIYLFIDEIPFDIDSVYFQQFVHKFCAMMNFFARKLYECSVYFMVSSISSPIALFENEDKQEKMSQFIKFLKIDAWTQQECDDLITILSNGACFEWEDVSQSEFAAEFRHSPRLIKNALKEACSLGYRRINKGVVERLKNY